jgi:hypothetical protein
MLGYNIAEHICIILNKFLFPNHGTFFGVNVQLYVLKNVGLIWKYAISHLQIQLKTNNIVYNQHFNKC